ncbi:S1/P1 nuclease [Pseudoalteromonas pernae]|uniref:S1/P1 nuclease n=1 Tax=Pseudoalteromonas pernae TaxID=3118054 RepID=UPI003241EAA0
MDLQHIREHFTAFVLATVLLIMTFTNHAFAWGANGHRIIGEIAQQNLSAEAKARIMAILGNHSLAQVSTWADEMRSSPNEFWQRQSSRWHYINIDSKDDFLLAPYKAKQHKHDIADAYSAVLTAIEVLSSPSSSAADQAFYLKFLIHLVGDIHQPLHVGRSADRGGNKINVEFFGKVTNLHRLWDSQLIDNQQLSYSEYVSFLCCEREQASEFKKDIDVKSWLLESHNLASAIYTDTPERISYAYVYENKAILEQQLLRGGLRLSALLNHIYQGTAG